jgi:hypothetical protein
MKQNFHYLFHSGVQIAPIMSHINLVHLVHVLQSYLLGYILILYSHLGLDLRI